MRPLVSLIPWHLCRTTAVAILAPKTYLPTPPTRPRNQEQPPTEPDSLTSGGSSPGRQSRSLNSKLGPAQMSSSTLPTYCPTSSVLHVTVTNAGLPLWPARHKHGWPSSKSESTPFPTRSRSHSLSHPKFMS
ncbi:hypothetical protein M408DRAFT_238797 [Serendipita vermifera MAFF 305830]|uniref:Secreted protein n=1 Tax=Serendipita vermifera MAFF 305830 TaxID=933852 RepID=A0A0C3BK02_SERVB|nr:hypothetical protein M408DRAFT_238797 [Serendipita vermifera MAFF 305830]